MKLSKKKIRFFLFLMLFFSMAFFITGAWYLPYVVAEVKNPVVALFNKSLRHTEKPDFNKYNLNGKEIIFTTRDSLQLSAYLIYGKPQVKGTVIALHGYRSNKNKYLPIARHFTEAGYNFAAMDLRGHNQSEGEMTGFSYFEKNDVLDFISYLKQKEHIQTEYILYGHSIGAATAIAVAAESDEISLLVLESIFASLENIIPNYIKFYTGIEIDSIPEGVENRVFESVEIPLDQINPEEQAKQIDVPVLFIHGEQDKKVPLEQARKIYENIQGEKAFIVIKSATHNTLWEEGGKDYFKTIIEFIDRFIQAKPNSEESS